jgi:hypothetical protein
VLVERGRSPRSVIVGGVGFPVPLVLVVGGGVDVVGGGVDVVVGGLVVVVLLELVEELLVAGGGVDELVGGGGV